MSNPWQREAVFLSYGDYLFRKGERDRAPDYFRRALDYFGRALDPIEREGREQDRADCFLRMGNVYLAKKGFPEALKHFDESLRIVAKLSLPEKLALPELAWQAHWGRGLALEGLGREGEAQREYDKAIGILEDLAEVAMQESERKIALRAARVEPFHAALRLALKHGKVARAFELSEQAKARTLLDALMAGRVDITKGMTEEEKKEYHRFMRDFASLRPRHLYALSQGKAKEWAGKAESLEKELAALESQYQAFRDRLYLKHPELKALQGHGEPIRCAQLTDLARSARLVILDYVVTKEDVLLFVITPSGVKRRDLGVKQGELSERIKELREKYAHPDFTPFPAIARRLYSRLVKPVERELAGAETVCIIPDGELAELPFHALVRRVGGREEYLVQSWAVVYAPSVSVLHWLAQTHPATSLPHPQSRSAASAL